MKVIEENATNWLVMTEDGSTETKTKDSPMNQLLYNHDLLGLIETGDSIWRTTHDERSVTIVPDENAERYTLDIDGKETITLSQGRKSDVMNALFDYHEEYDGDDLEPFLELYDDVQGNMLRQRAIRPLLDALSEKVQERDDGWLVNGHLLITYEGDFYHPNKEAKNRDGSVIGQGMSVEAYNVVSATPDDDMPREIGEYRLTDKEMQFVAQVVWAVNNLPDMS